MSPSLYRLDFPPYDGQIAEPTQSVEKISPAKSSISPVKSSVRV